MANYNCRLCLFLIVLVEWGRGSLLVERWSSWLILAHLAPEAPRIWVWLLSHMQAQHGVVKHTTQTHKMNLSVCYAERVFILFCFLITLWVYLVLTFMGTSWCGGNQSKLFAKQWRISGMPESGETGRRAVRPQHGDFTWGPDSNCGVIKLNSTI